MKIIEFTCTRNEGRSPVAEFIAQWHLAEKGLDKEYRAVSSGSHRDEPDPNEVQSTSGEKVPIETLVSLVELGIEQSIFDDITAKEARGAIDSNDSNSLALLFSQANKVFKDHERHYRADAVHRLVEEFGLHGYLKAHSDQTRPRQDVIAVFAMSSNNTKKVREIYKNSGYSPVIETLSAYATEDSEANLPNAFAKGQNFYDEVIDKLYKQIPIVIDKLISDA